MQCKHTQENYNQGYILHMQSCVVSPYNMHTTCFYLFLFLHACVYGADKTDWRWGNILNRSFFLSCRCGLRWRKKTWRGKRRKGKTLKAVLHSVCRQNTLGLVHTTSAPTAWRTGRSGSKPWVRQPRSTFRPRLGTYTHAGMQPYVHVYPVVFSNILNKQLHYEEIPF